MDAPPRVRIILPVYNEADILDTSVRRLASYLAESGFPYPYRVVIVDNASTDGTLALAQALAHELPGVGARALSRKGKGHAIREGWKGSEQDEPADILSFMDIDLASDLAYFRPLIDAVASGGADIAIGNRLGEGSFIEGRRLPRELASRAYNRIVRSVFASKLADHQCGFKAISARAHRDLAAHLVDEGWFFDTELLVLAQQRGLKIRPVDIRWNDSRHSKVSLVSTSLDILKAVSAFEERLVEQGVRPSWRRFSLWWQIGKFLVSGVAAAALNLGLFALLVRGVGMSYLPAVIVTSLAVFVASFALQKFWTFDDSNPAAAYRELPKFALSALATALANALLLALFVGQLGTGPIVAQFFALALLAAINFFVYKFLVFRR